MDARQADLLRKIDPALLGQRLRAARVAKAMTQTDLAGADVSVGYVSRIEAGHRRPNLQVLTDLCGRLGTPVEQLLMGVAPQELEQIKLNLDFAELSLESGDPQTAELQARDAREAAEAASLKEHTYRARFLIARALEAQGLIDDAVIELEALLTPRVGNVLQIKVGLALVRCYKTSGDFAKAVEVGEMLLEHLTDTPLDNTDEAVQLAVSMAAAYYFRGDIAQAVRVCRKAMAKAERLDSPVARASAYWNASIFEAGRGSVRDAVPLAQRALALFAEGQDGRNLAVLRTNLGSLQLQLDPPQLDEAKQNLEQAAEEMRGNSAGPVDIGRNELAQARAHYLSGDFDIAEVMTTRVLENVRTLVAAHRSRRQVPRGSGARSARRCCGSRGGLPRSRADPDGSRVGPRGGRDVVRARRTLGRRRRVRRGSGRLPQRCGGVGHPVAAADQGREQAGCGTSLIEVSSSTDAARASRS